MAKEFKISTLRLKELEQELFYLKTTREKEVAEQIKEARSFGDLSENSEYDEAKNEQAIIEGRIAEIEAQLKNVRVLDESELSDGSVHVGSKVDVLNVSTKKAATYRIVGSTESDPMSGKISDESPVGKALLGHVVGDVVEVEIPAGIINYEITAISK
mgnify:CR=1 FL=1